MKTGDKLTNEYTGFEFEEGQQLASCQYKLSGIRNPMMEVNWVVPKCPLEQYFRAWKEGRYMGSLGL